MKLSHWVLMALSLLLAVNQEKCDAGPTIHVSATNSQLSPVGLQQPYVVVANTTSSLSISPVNCVILGPAVEFAVYGVNRSNTLTLWSLNGSGIYSGGQGLTTTTSVIQPLTFLQATSILSWPAIIPLSLTGTYTCGLGPVSRSFSLRVVVAAQISFISKSLNLTPGQVAVLQCNAVGDHPITIMWLKNGALVVTAARRSLLLSINGLHNDTTMYTCMVSNPYGNDSASVEVAVHMETMDALGSSPSQQSKTLAVTSEFLLNSSGKGGCSVAQWVAIAGCMGLAVGISPFAVWLLLRRRSQRKASAGTSTTVEVSVPVLENETAIDGPGPTYAVLERDPNAVPTISDD